MVNWQSLSMWKKMGLIMAAEALWTILIWVILSFAVWDFGFMVSWRSVRFILGMWFLTAFVFGLLKGYEAILKREARKQK